MSSGGPGGERFDDVVAMGDVDGVGAERMRRRGQLGGRGVSVSARHTLHRDGVLTISPHFGAELAHSSVEAIAWATGLIDVAVAVHHREGACPAFRIIVVSKGAVARYAVRQ